MTHKTSETTIRIHVARVEHEVVDVSASRKRDHHDSGRVPTRNGGPHVPVP